MRLTSQQQQTLQAVANRLIPPDDYPDAWSAGVGDYLARQFEGDLQHLVENYAAGLDALERESQAQHGSAFEILEATQQDHLLQAIERGEVTTEWTLPPAQWLRMVIDHTAQGYYGAPLNGGNRGAVSWHMVGFDK